MLDGSFSSRTHRLTRIGSASIFTSTVGQLALSRLYHIRIDRRPRSASSCVFMTMRTKTHPINIFAPTGMYSWAAQHDVYTPCPRGESGSGPGLRRGREPQRLGMYTHRKFRDRSRRSAIHSPCGSRVSGTSCSRAEVISARDRRRCTYTTLQIHAECGSGPY